MPFCAFMGDELTAAGFRLAGVAVHTPAPGEASEVFERLCRDTPLILMTPDMLDALPAGRLVQIRLDGQPLVLVTADARNRHPVPDPVDALRRQLGLAE